MMNIQLSPELQKELTDFARGHNLSMREMAQLYDMIATRESILMQHKIPITLNEKSQRWYTRLPNGKQIGKAKRADVEDEIIKHYSNLSTASPLPSHSGVLQPQDVTTVRNLNSGDTRTLTTIYPEWLKLRRCEVSANTLADDLSYWKRYIASSDIANIPLNQLGRTKLKKWACEMVTQHQLKKKYFSNVKRTLNSLLDFAVDEELLDVNHLRNIKINPRLYTAASFKEEHEEVFTEQEQMQVMKEAEDDSREQNSALPLGICLLFLTGMRVGELCALRNCDIKGDYLYVRRMVVENQSETSDGGLVRSGYTIVEHAKSSAGMRKIYLTAKAREYLTQIRTLNETNGYPCADTDLIFQRKEGMCNQRVFDSRLKKYCNPNHLNLPFAKSCHDIRRTYISHLFDSGINPDTIRRMAGHENIEMTMKYCKGRKAQEDLEKILEQSFSA